MNSESDISEDDNALMLPQLDQLEVPKQVENYENIEEEKPVSQPNIWQKFQEMNKAKQAQNNAQHEEEQMNQEGDDDHYSSLFGEDSEDDFGTMANEGAEVLSRL